MQEPRSESWERILRAADENQESVHERFLEIVDSISSAAEKLNSVGAGHLYQAVVGLLDGYGGFPSDARFLQIPYGRGSELGSSIRSQE